MNLHEDKKLFHDAISATSDFKGIREVYIEKDYWVTYALKTIFADSIGVDTIFKGGTALSKCFNIIERFSEDIDLVVVSRKGDTDTGLKNKIREVSKTVESVLPEVEIKGITRKRGMNRKTAHKYTKQVSGKYGQVRDIIIIEASWLGSTEPNTKHLISTYIYEMMEAKGQNETAEKYDLLPFEIQVLDLRRTLCEKIMSLVRFSYTDDPILDIGNKIRHTYDLHLMLEQDEIITFFKSSEFDALLKKVAKDDIASYRNGNEWLSYHPADAMIFKDIDNVWEALKKIYEGDFKNLVYGELPDEQKIHDTLSKIKTRLEEIEWDIESDNES